MSNESMLPILLNNDNQSTFNSEEDQITFDTEEQIQIYDRNSKGKNQIIISVFLSMITVISFFLYAFSSEQGFFNGDRLLSYLSNDFLGIDLSNTEKNIFELLMSESFGNTSSDNSENSNTIPDNAADSEASGSTDAENEKDTPEDNVNGQEGIYQIIEADLSYEGIGIQNKTDYEIDINKYLTSSGTEDGYKLSINEDMTLDPIVLIIHTHGTEGFSEPGLNTYSDSVNIPRSEDTKKNIVAVGREMAAVLNEKGVPTIHCQIMHDKESYKNSYQRAEQTILTYLKKYPSIKYVLDIHRDSVIDDKNNKYKPTTLISEKKTAQIMFVMGTDATTPEHKDWSKNLTLALKLTQQLNNNYPSFTRRMSLRDSSYNQQYTKGSMLIEVGSCANTLEEAVNAGVIIAYELSEIIKNGW